MAWLVRYGRIVAVLLVVEGFLAAGCKTDNGPAPGPHRQQTMDTTYTADHVKAVRARTGFDDKAMQIRGVIGVGTGGESPSDSWISVLCTNEAARDSAQQALGTEIEGVPIRYRVTGVIRAQ